MLQLAPEYLAELARQVAFLAGFLGGFAATFVAMLLPSSSQSRAVAWSIGLAAAAAVAFIVSVVAATMLIVATHPRAPIGVTTEIGLARARIVTAGAFLLGLYLLVASIGLSGWLRSPKLGCVTSIVACLGAIIISWAIAGF